MKEVAIVLFAYLIGSIPTAYGVGRAVKNIDIRRYGSGNVGASNLWVHVGRWLVFPVGAFDLFAKGALPVYLAQRLDTGPWIPVAAGLAAVAGHNWSIYLKLTGGRGIAVVLGVLLVLAWKELVAAALVTIGGWLIFRSSALWVGIGVASLSAWSVGFREPTSVIVLCVCLAALVAAKRLVANRGTAAPGTRWRNVWVYRLLYDRDTSDRDAWVQRNPPEAQKDD